MSTDRTRAITRAASRKSYDDEPGYQPLAFLRTPAPDRKGRPQVRVETLEDGALLVAVADGRRVAQARRSEHRRGGRTVQTFSITMANGRGVGETYNWASARQMVAWAGGYLLALEARGIA